MFKSLKDFLKKDKKGPQMILDLTEVPRWMDDQIRQIEESLERDTRNARGRIPESMRRLGELVEELQSLEHDPTIHPKLKKIAKNTLPLFEKAMQSNLRRVFSEDPEEFYQTAVESLKGCVNATRAQGRYLQTVFPSQMKQIRTAIDLVGRDINAMTPVIGETRKRKARISEVKAVHERLVVLIGDLSGAEMRFPLKGQRIKELEAELEKHRNTICDLEASTGYKEILQIKEEAHRLGDEQRKVQADLHILESVILHVFDKGEKIAMRSHDTHSLKLLQKVTHYVASSGKGEREEFMAAVADDIPVVMKMVSEGSIILKNKEEKMIFSDPERYVGEIRAYLSRNDALEAEIRTEEERFLMHPLSRERDRLDEECRDLYEALDKESALLMEDERRISHAKATIPVEKDQIERIIRDITGKDFVLQI